MANKIKYVGIALIVIGAATLLVSQTQGWNNNNAVNFGSAGAMIAGLITYIIAGKKGYQE